MLLLPGQCVALDSTKLIPVAVLGCASSELMQKSKPCKNQFAFPLGWQSYHILHAFVLYNLQSMVDKCYKNAERLLVSVWCSWRKPLLVSSVEEYDIRLHYNLVRGHNNTTLSPWCECFFVLHKQITVAPLEPVSLSNWNWNYMEPDWNRFLSIRQT